MSWETYWEERKHLAYYQVVKKYLEELGSCESIIDVGCGGCPVAKWGDFQNRTSLNLESFPAIEGVDCVQSDWMNYHEKATVITCLQVIEHFDDEFIPKFVQKIFDSCKIAIISVPYMWEEGACEYHKQDPIDMAKFLRLVRRDPVKTEIASHRLVAKFCNIVA